VHGFNPVGDAKINRRAGAQASFAKSTIYKAVVQSLIVSSIPIARHFLIDEREENMRKVFLFAIALTLWAGVAFMLRRAARQDSFPRLHDNNPVQTRAAFRDGLYLGGLAAQRGEEPHISEGRWSNQADRILFTAGYAQGYDEGIAVRAAVVNRRY
jgi:hypothetical protein